jgi:hypothetical protein
MHLTISRLGTMAGTIVGAATYTSLIAISATANTVLDTSIDIAGLILSKGAGKLLGPAAEITLTAACRTANRLTTGSIQAYSPIVVGALSAAAGLGTSLIVSAGEYCVTSISNKIKEKYEESNMPRPEFQLLEYIPEEVEQEHKEE